MSDKNLELSLRIKADLAQGQAQVKAFEDELEKVETSAKSADAALTDTSTAVQVLSDQVADAATELQDASRALTSVDSAATATDNALAQTSNTAQELTTQIDRVVAELQAAGRTFTFAGQSSFSFRESVTQTSTATQALSNQLDRVVAELQTAGRTFSFAGQSSFSFRDSVQGATLSAREQAIQLAKLVSTYDALVINARKLVADEALLKKAFADGKISAEQYHRMMANITQRNQQLAGSYTQLRGVAQNFGWQLQDIAVQMQAGVSPAVILSQQGSQLVSAFNPLAGAAVAVGGALAGALLPALFSNSDAAEQLNQKIRDLYENYRNLGEAQRQQLINAEAAKQARLIDEIAREKIELDKLAKSYEDLKSAQGTSSFVDRIATGGQFENIATTKDLTIAEEKLTTARATLETKNRELADSEKEVRRIRGETIVDEEEINKKANDLVENLKEQVETYKLSGEELGRYMTKKIGITGTLRDEIIELYKQAEAQKVASKAEAEASAEDEKRKREAEAKLKSNEDYVRALETQAAAISLTTKQLNDRQNAERGLTGQMLLRAEAAQKINAQAKEAKVLEALELQLLKAKGSELEAARADLKLRYDQLLSDLTETSRERGQEIITELINLEQLQLQLRTAEKEIDKVLSNQQRRETSINTQREAGLITEFEARRRIVELHQETYQELEKQRPLLEEMARQPGAVGEAGARALEELNAQAELLLTTVGLLESTLRTSLESGLSDAIQGLAKGTYTLREAVHALSTTVVDSMIKLGADYLAQSAVSGLFGGGKDQGESMKEGAAATSTAAGLLTSAATLWSGVAAQIQAAAASLAASGGAAGGAGAGAGAVSAGGGGSYAGLIQMGAMFLAADGGHITGPGTSTSDSIPAMLSNDEFVTRAAVVTQPGALSFLKDFNRRGMAALPDWTPSNHNTGGLAGVPAPAMPSPILGNAKLPEPSKAFSATLQNSQNFYLVDDPARIAETMKSPAGEEAIFVAIKRNPGKFRSLMNV